MDEHTHCPCNLTRLCRTCHVEVTVNPAKARDTGWQVSRAGLPHEIPMLTVWGQRQPTCSGGWEGERNG